MERFIVEIRHKEHYVACEFSSNIPFMLADEIKRVVNEFYKED